MSGPGPKTVTVSGTSLNNIQTDIDKRSKEPFNFDYGKYLSAVIKREDENVVKQLAHGPAGPADLSLDHYPLLNVADMAYGKVWSYDHQTQQYSREENGRKIQYDEAQSSNPETCYATYLGGVVNGQRNAEGCKRVINCIADGDPKSLSRCLNVLGDKDLWKIASDDALKVGPEKVRLVLRKFGIKGHIQEDSNGKQFKVPMSYDEWIKDVVNNRSVMSDPNVSKTITNNRPLINYIQGLLNACRNNHSILNKHNPSVIARENVPQYMRDLSMQKYKIPVGTSKVAFEYFAESLRNSVYPKNVNNDLYNPIISGSMSNVAFFSPYSTSAPGMMGGGFDSVVQPGLPSSGTNTAHQFRALKNGSGSTFKSLFQRITNSLNDVGLSMHPDDRDRIKNAIRQVEKYEDQLAKLCIILNTLVKLARAYGISFDNIDKNTPKHIDLSKINSFDDLSQFIREYVKDITKNMVSNVNIQQSINYDLMNKVYSRFASDCAGAIDSPASTSRSSNNNNLVDL